MPRIARLIIEGEPAVYHVISRTVLDGYPLGEAEKNEIIKILLQFSKLYFAEMFGFCIMGNHFHLLVRMSPGADLSDDAIRDRYTRFYGDGPALSRDKIQGFRMKWSRLSEFVREIKQTFSRYYNKRHDRRGFLWSERYKSLIVEEGEALINCLAYIDLNPIRAGIADRPETYRWCSIGYHVLVKNKGKLLSLDFRRKEDRGRNEKERLRQYRQFIYDAGALTTTKGKTPARVDEKDIERQHGIASEITREHRFRCRNRYFSDAGVIGSKAFVSKNYRRFKDNFTSKHEKKPKPIRGLDGIYSLKRLTEP